MAAGFAACDDGSGDNGGSGPIVAGSGNGTGTGGSSTGTGGTGPGASGSSSTAGSGTTTGGSGPVGPEGVPITPSAGWIAKESNALGVQGAAFSFADTTSLMGMTDNLKDVAATTSCIKGTAAKVDMASDACVNKMFTAPATDCYGQYWGAALGFNLNQAIDMTLVPPAGGTPMAFDASLIKGFYFEITDHDDHTGMVPAPSALRFKVDDGSKEYCNTAMLKLKSGANTVLFSDLTTECWAPTDTSSKITAEVEKKFIKIAWQVVTNSSATVPFDFCVGNVKALLKDGAVIPTGTGGSSSGTGGSAPATGGTSAGGSASTSGGSSSGGTASASGGSGGKAGSGG
jgi:uncharacterized membrane protein YgcG